MSLLEQTNKTKRFSFKGDIKLAKCVDVYDGDTAQFVFYVKDDFYRYTCRFMGYNSAEIKSSNEEEKKKAIKSRDYLSDLILNKICIVEFDDNDKYQRPLITVYIMNMKKYDEILIFSHIHMTNKSYIEKPDDTIFNIVQTYTPVMERITKIIKHEKEDISKDDFNIIKNPSLDILINVNSKMLESGNGKEYTGSGNKNY